MISYYKNSLLEYFSQLNSILDNPYADIEKVKVLQLKLIHKTIYIERKIKNNRTKLVALKVLKRNLFPNVESKTRSSTIKQQINNLNSKIDDYQYLLNILKKIGDGIAFSLIDKWDIKPMSFKESPGFISGKKGLRLEKKIFNYAFSKGFIALFNDLTLSIRYGDITIINPKFKLPIIIEVKSSLNKNKRIERQLESLNKINDYLITDEVENLYNTPGKMKRVVTHSKEVTHIDSLDKMISESLINRSSFKILEDGLAYYVATKISQQEIEEYLLQIKYKPTAILVNEFNNENNFKGYYPILLSIKEPLAKYMFLNNEIIIICFIDYDMISQYFILKGFEMSFENSSDYLFKLYNKKNDMTLKVSRHFFYRLFTEFVSLKWILAELESKFKYIENEFSVMV